MGILKLVLDDNLGYDFTLIAIHGVIEPYYLAFLLNKHNDLKLARSSKDLVIDVDGFSVPFPIYEYEDEYQYITYHLFSNRTRISRDGVRNVSGLFESEMSQESQFFIKDLPKVDYLLKVSEDGTAFAKAKTLKTLNQIPQIVTAYTVDVDQLKTKENLIFE